MWAIVPNWVETALRVFSILFLISLPNVLSIREEDLITNLPNVTFQVNFKQYSGYLNANNEGNLRLFYWVTESMNNPEENPLIIWFNGGPGCSSLSGLLTEYGPFFVNRNGSSLYENVYSWNKHFNLMFLESPVGTGFSYDTDDPDEYTVGDDETAEQNFHALVDFFTRVQPKYRNLTWFLAGESYAGIYIPTLANLVLRAIQFGEFPNNNFQGIAIGNGYLNVKNLTNSLLHFNVHHGSIGTREWKEIRQTCCNKTEPIEQCDFSSHVAENITDSWALDECGKLFIASMDLPDNQNPYNYFLDCYKPDWGVEKLLPNNSKLKRILQTANTLNYDSTDNQLGFNCWNEVAIKQYLNRADVRSAIHIADDWIKHENISWSVCNDDLNEDYVPKYVDTFDLFIDIIKRSQKLKHKLPSNFRMLIFNGDVDTVCNFIGDAWHLDNIANHARLEASDRVPWKFRDQIAGYVQRYGRMLPENNSINIDVMTVKGAGHFVSDRPGPALQMIVNFVKGNGNYTNDQDIDTMPMTNDLVEEIDLIVDTVISNDSGRFSITLWRFSIILLLSYFGY